MIPLQACETQSGTFCKWAVALCHMRTVTLKLWCTSTSSLTEFFCSIVCIINLYLSIVLKKIFTCHILIDISTWRLHCHFTSFTCYICTTLLLWTLHIFTLCYKSQEIQDWISFPSFIMVTHGMQHMNNTVNAAYAVHTRFMSWFTVSLRHCSQSKAHRQSCQGKSCFHLRMGVTCSLEWSSPHGPGHFVSSTSFASSLAASCYDAGIFSSAHISMTLSLMSNPWSANTRSPGNSLLRRPLFSVTCLSLTQPPHPLEMKVIAPCGVMPMRYFRVCLCL